MEPVHLQMTSTHFTQDFLVLTLCH